MNGNLLMVIKSNKSNIMDDANNNEDDVLRR